MYTGVLAAAQTSRHNPVPASRGSRRPLFMALSFTEGSSIGGDIERDNLG
jgi:hypothetical protein